MSIETNEDGLSTFELQELMKFCSICPEEFFGVQPCDIFLKNAIWNGCMPSETKRMHACMPDIEAA